MMNATLSPNDTDTSARESVPVPDEPATTEKRGPDAGDERLIALDRLLPSPDNVRTLRPARDPADAQLVASIRARGLLKNLVVVPVDGRDGWFEVTAGERRRLAHLALVADGTFVPGVPVRCLVRSREQAVGDSLAENVGHKPMHPAERYAAFKRLVDDGASEQDVARQFGLRVTDVRRHLRIGSLHTTLLRHFARDRMTFDAVLAYAATGDVALQLAVFKALGSRPDADPSAVRRAIREARVPAKAGIARFVGLAAYRRAGGRTEEDLIEGTTQLVDLDVLQRLAHKQLARAADALDGWAWVEPTMPEDAAPSRFHRAPRAVAGVPAALTTRLDELRAREAVLEAIDYDDATPEQNEEYDTILEEMTKIEDTIRTEYTVVDEAVRRFAGCVVTFDATSGEPVVHEGLQRAEDRAAQCAAEAAVQRGEEGGEGDDGEDDGDADDEPAKPALSSAHSRDLARYRRAAVRATLAQTPVVATMLLQYHLCAIELGDYRCGRRLLALDGQPDSDQTTRDDLETTDAFARLAATRERLDVSWLEHEGHDARYAAFVALSRSRRDALVAFCVARQLDAGSIAKGYDALPGAVVDALDTDTALLWRPSAANHFTRLKRDALIELGVKWYGETFRLQSRQATKGSIVDRFERLFHGPAKDLTDAEREIRATWLPVEMR